MTDSYRSPKTFLIAVALIAAGFIWVLSSRTEPTDRPSGAIQAPQQGFLAPDFTLETLQGESITLEELRGRAVILNYWASWCPPCRAEMPAFQQAYQEWEDDSLLILGVNATNQDALSDVSDFTNQYRLEFPILLDIQGVVGNRYQIHSLPTTFFIDKQGVIRDILIGGPIPLPLLRIKAGQILEEPTDAPPN